jgi:hypothetical protein
VTRASSSSILGLAVELVAVAVLGATTVGCGAAQAKPCRASASCADGESCVIGRCTIEKEGVPVETGANRFVLEPESIAWVSSSGDDPALRPAAVSLGAEVGDKTRLLLAFPRGPWLKDRVKKAYLVFDRAEGAQAGPGEVMLRAERIVEAWSLKGGAGTTWASPPRSEPLVGSETKVGSRGAGSVRIDVTPFAVELANKKSRVFGLRVEGKGEGYGLPIATGAIGASGPRLEVYVQ